jgi:hypothetical protein
MVGWGTRAGNRVVQGAGLRSDGTRCAGGGRRVIQRGALGGGGSEGAGVGRRLAQCTGVGGGSSEGAGRRLIVAQRASLGEGGSTGSTGRVRDLVQRYPAAGAGCAGGGVHVLKQVGTGVAGPAADGTGGGRHVVHGTRLSINRTGCTGWCVVHAARMGAAGTGRTGCVHHAAMGADGTGCAGGGQQAVQWVHLV